MAASLVCVLRGGGRYDARWVGKLAGGARRFAPEFERFVCLSDMPVDVEGVETIPLRHGWPVWWSKFEAFRPGLFDGPTVLCDLDTVFTAPAPELARPGLAAMEDYFHKGRLSSALMRWSGDELAGLHETFAADPERWMAAGSCGAVPNAVHGDQVVIDHLLRGDGRLPAFFQHLHPDLLGFYDPQKPVTGSITIFIGDSKPDTARGPVADLWREAG